MTSPTKIRASAKGGITEVRVLMQHDMENGRRKDEAGNLIPAWYITEIKRSITAGLCWKDSSAPRYRNPYLVFRFKGGAAGDKITLSWLDNRGETRSDEVAIN